MQQFSYLAAIPASFFSRALYRDVAIRWQGMSLMYLFWITVVTVALSLIIAGFTLKRFMSSEMADAGISPRDVVASLISQWPTLEYKDGQMHVADEKDDPTIINLYLPDEDPIPLVLIKMDGGIEDFSANEDEGVWAVLTSTAVHFRKSDGKIETQIWAQQDVEDNLVIDQQMLSEGYNALEQWLVDNQTVLVLSIGGVCWVFGVFGMFIYRLVQVLIAGLACQLIGQILRVSRPYDVMVRLSVVALTPVWILHVVAAIVNSPLEAWHTIVISLGFLGFAVHSNRMPDEPRLSE